jgi:hypothetical protein
MKIHGYTIDNVRRIDIKKEEGIQFTANGEDCFIGAENFYLKEMAELGLIHWVTESEETYNCFGEQDFKMVSHDPEVPEWDDLENKSIENILEHYLNEEDSEGLLEDCLLACAVRQKNRGVDLKKLPQMLNRQINRIGS